MAKYGEINQETEKLLEVCKAHDKIASELYEQLGVKRGLRDKDGNGVLTGITNISKIDAFEIVDGQKTPCEGKLWYRGYNVIDLIKGFEGKRYGFEEVTGSYGVCGCGGQRNSMRISKRYRRIYFHRRY